MIQLKRTDSSDTDFRNLVTELDKFLAILNGEEDTFFAQHNKTDLIRHTVVAIHEETPCGCGAIKEYEPEIMEVKRMFVHPDKRELGIATKVLNELEQWALELGYKKCILETSKELKAAISLYTKNGYNITPNYGQYKDVESSICFEKQLIKIKQS
ncbi:GNAT family N-acetyltransferase [Flavobacterium alkalisoli]|uniref:GNAT family N-acetyltransferase n=1 Tax=Flavobacterium alkalisoli TaxID=2602769 RepID=UPI003A8CCAC6